MQNAPVSIRLGPKSKRMVKELAEHLGMSQSALFRYLIAEEWARRFPGRPQPDEQREED